MMDKLKLYLDMPELIIATTLAETTIQKMIRDNEFPAPRQIAGRRVGWLVDEVKEWARTRPKSELPPPPNTGAKKPGRGRPQSPRDDQKGA
ncbi:MAG: hypothetical protein GAK35_02747 [Herbaspirillum frisingense]|uniref:AlpA family phage regulatory protein n=1 Tax=Herbaspirillum frisingense TaxID=92645 RepID=A0A7V8FVM1_9BURK|nr:MAG: hypothetical protein GAK35_02747 [Herbaspirillum frisingense]